MKYITKENRIPNKWNFLLKLICTSSAVTGVLLMESMATSAGVDDNIPRPIFW